MRRDPVIARLATANPFPGTAPPAQRARDVGLRRRAVVAALATAIVVPALAFASDVGNLFGFSASGTAVDVSDTPFAHVSGLSEAMAELGFPSTLRLIASRDGIEFYAARRADGRMCVAVDAAPGSPAHKGVGCDLGNPSLAGEPGFPSAARPILDFSRFTRGAQLAGFAADGVATVELLDTGGGVIASAPVSDNVYADADPPAGGAGVQALDGSGAVVYRRTFDQLP